MGNKGQTPLANPINEVLGAGAVYFNYGLENERAVGATKGGNSFEVEREWYEPEQDGAYGHVKGDRTKTRVSPALTINALELSEDNMQLFIAGLKKESDDGDYTEYREQLGISEDDYLDNVAFVGETKDGSDVVIIVENALGDGETSFEMAAKEGVVPEITFTGHYNREKPRQVPYTMRFPKRGNSESEAEA